MFASIQYETNRRMFAAESILNEIKDGLISDATENNINNVKKGVFFVALYGALEYTLTEVVSVTIRCINAKNVDVKLLRPRLLSLAFNPQFNAVKEASARQWEKRHDLLLLLECPTLFQAEDHLRPLPSGNIKFKSINFAWELFGLSSDVVPDKRIQGLFDSLANNRMAVAHGRITPQDVGRDYTKGELVNFYNSIKSYLAYIITSFEDYVKNEEYLLVINNP